MLQSSIRFLQTTEFASKRGGADLTGTSRVGKTESAEAPEAGASQALGLLAGLDADKSRGSAVDPLDLSVARGGTRSQSCKVSGENSLRTVK
jgi:hypothetical protein